MAPGNHRLPPISSRSPLHCPNRGSMARMFIGLREGRRNQADWWWCVPVRSTATLRTQRRNLITPARGYTNYGGASWTIVDGAVYSSNFADGRLYCQTNTSFHPIPLTPAPALPERQWRFADGVIDRARQRWIGVLKITRISQAASPDGCWLADMISSLRLVCRRTAAGLCG
jgi:hypothetical protein